MLSTKQAAKIGKRGGQARARNLSPEKRREVASWARLIRAQKKLGLVTEAEQRHRLIELVRTEDPDLAALLNFLLSHLPAHRADELYQTVSDERRRLVELKLGEVLCG